jgi:hypothetical protein
MRGRRVWRSRQLQFHRGDQRRRGGEHFKHRSHVGNDFRYSCGLERGGKPRCRRFTLRGRERSAAAHDLRVAGHVHGFVIQRRHYRRHAKH